MKLRVSPRAAADVRAIVLRIAFDSPRAAIALNDDIERRLLQLVRHPHSGMPREDLAPGLRHLVIGRHLAYYRVTAEAIDVLRVLHGMRQIAAADLDEG